MDLASAMSSVPASRRSALAPPPSAWAIVFGSFLESALRNPAAADGQQGRLFIGFAAAELLGLMAFVVAMIILLRFLRAKDARSGAPRRDRLPQLSQLPEVFCRSFSGWRSCSASSSSSSGGDGAEDPGHRRSARKEDRERPRAAQAARVAADETEAAWRARMDAARAEAAGWRRKPNRPARQETEAKVQAAADKST